jgi:pimeloyl-ACP methyl ester carboxylesterase
VTSAIAKELESRGVDEAVAVGHGLGGMLAMKLGAERPDLIEGVIAVDATPAYPLNFQGFKLTPEERASTIAGNFLKNTERMDPVAWRARWREIAGRQAAGEEDQRMLEDLSEELDFATWRRWIVEQSIPDLTEPLKESGVRLLAAAAINDGVRGALGSEVMAEEFWRLPFDDWPEASVTFFDDARHFLFLDRPQAFDATVERFVENQPQPDWAYGEPGEGPAEPDAPETEDAGS